MKTRIGVLGAKGRMGQEVVRAVRSPRYSDRAEVAIELDHDGKIDSLLSGVDAIIDFSSPQAVVALAQAGADSIAPPVLVIGSTGWKIDERRVVEKYAEKAPVVMASNFSTGVLAVCEMLKRFSPLLEKLGYVPVIQETHHKHKKDAPSGTALSLQRMISPAGPGNVQTHSVRAGEVIGDHEVTFYGHADKITLGHFAAERSIFATGAVDVALWLQEQRRAGKTTKGLMGMDPFFKDLLTQAGIGGALG